MKRRAFLKALAAGLLAGGFPAEIMALNSSEQHSQRLHRFDMSIKDYLHKMNNFNRPHKDDIRVSSSEYPAFTAAVKRLKRLQQYVGHGNFQCLSFDQGLFFARNYSSIGEFTRKELAFMEKIFYMDAARYGFLGEKPLKRITDHIKKKNVVKVPYSGTYLHRGTSVEVFRRIEKKIGEELVLTSGVRSIMKQFLLFLDKAYKNDGNLSLASRSLAPPGYSFHGIGDFDVGQRGFGINNFTAHFTGTTVYSKLLEHGYLALRYPDENLLGVRFEPWHIQVAHV